MKNEQSTIRPMRFIVEHDFPYSRITMTDVNSVHEVVVDGVTMYEYKQYTTERPFRADLSESIANDFDGWFSVVKEEDAARAAYALRLERNRRLSESDKEMAFDRLGLVPSTGSTVTTWLPFLVELGKALSGEWAKYRQALRDLPTLPNWPYLTPEDWPTLPTERGEAD